MNNNNTNNNNQAIKCEESGERRATVCATFANHTNYDCHCLLVGLMLLLMLLLLAMMNVYLSVRSF